MTSAAPGLVVIVADDTPAQAWRNGGGSTRELLAWPAADAWRVRVSRADIDRDGPFSAYPQVDRWFAVLAGHGVVLQFADSEHRLGTHDEALHFDGAAAPGCRLVAGPTQDLNLMLRGAGGEMQRWYTGQGWDCPHQARGLYTTAAGQWQCGNEMRVLPAHSLLWSWSGNNSTWNFQPHDPQPGASAWWLGCTLQD
ncbi:MAG: HutD family protein [Rhodoferax sp.]|nr:HutD family protein [Rhodoferax sp.]